VRTDCGKNEISSKPGAPAKWNGDSYVHSTKQSLQRLRLVAPGQRRVRNKAVTE